MNSADAEKRRPRGVRFARIVYLVAGIVGLIEIVPLYFYEAALNRTQPPPITHPEFYYGFVGVTLAWQVAFLVIARDPLRFRPLMPVSWIEKLLYPVAVGMVVFGGTDSRWRWCHRRCWTSCGWRCLLSRGCGHADRSEASLPALQLSRRDAIGAHVGRSTSGITTLPSAC